MLTQFNKLALVGLLTSTMTANADPIDAVANINQVVQAASVLNTLAMLRQDRAEGSVDVQVPRLKITSSCKSCDFGNASKMMMHASYQDIATKHGVVINKEKRLHFIVTSMVTRPSFLRGTLGVLSGADFVGGHFEGDEKHFSQFSISHEMGIDEVTQKLGEALFIEVLRKQLALKEVANNPSEMNMNQDIKHRETEPIL